MKRDGSIERAIELAVNMHAGQVDKVGAPYILHPLRVMVEVSWMENSQKTGIPELGPDNSAMIVAVLHDICEDTDVEPEDLAGEGFTEDEVRAIWLLTRPPAGPGRPSHAEYIKTIRDAPGEAGRLARRVKIADVSDNLLRNDLLPEKERGIEKRYKQALGILYGLEE